MQSQESFQSNLLCADETGRGVAQNISNMAAGRRLFNSNFQINPPFLTKREIEATAVTGTIKNHVLKFFKQTCKAPITSV